MKRIIDYSIQEYAMYNIIPSSSLWEFIMNGGYLNYFKGWYL